MRDKAVNLSENFKSSGHHKRLQYGKFDVYAAKIGERGFKFDSRVLFYGGVEFDSNFASLCAY